jgi:hypothetical protein
VTVITAFALELNENLRATSRSLAAQTLMSLRDIDALGSGPASFSKRTLLRERRTVNP